MGEAEVLVLVDGEEGLEPGFQMLDARGQVLYLPETGFVGAWRVAGDGDFVDCERSAVVM